MDISKHLPDNLPPNWAELEKEMRALAEQHKLLDMRLCVEMIECERSDVRVEEILRPLLHEFPSIKHIHICYEADEVSYYHIWVETDAEGRELQRIRDAEELAERQRVQNRQETNGSFNFLESEEDFRMHASHSTPAVIIDRTNT